MNTGDIVSLGILGVAALTSITSLVAVVNQRRMVKSQLVAVVNQGRMVKSQLDINHFNMYQSVYQPVTDLQMRDLEDGPEQYMSVEIFKRKYKGRKKRIRQYISMTKIYEYLVYKLDSRERHRPYPLGEVWLNRWLVILRKNKTFLDVNKYLGPYHPEFGNLVLEDNYFKHE